jgi:hypothetical protein
MSVGSPASRGEVDARPGSTDGVARVLRGVELPLTDMFFRSVGWHCALLRGDNRRGIKSVAQVGIV